MANRRLLQSAQAFRKGSFDEAYQLAHAAIAIRMRTAQAWLVLGEACMHLRRYDEALQAFNAVLSLSGHEFYDTARYGHATTLLLMNRLDDAIAGFTEALKTDPERAESYLNRGVACFRLGRLEDAIADFDRAIEHEPVNFDALQNKVECLIRLGKLDEAQELCNEAIEIDPDDIRAQERFRQIRLKRQEFAARADAGADGKSISFETVRNGTDAAPFSQETADLILRAAASRLLEKRYSEAADLLDRLVELQPENGDALFRRAQVRHFLSNIPGAIADCDAALRGSPQWLAALALRVELHLAEEKPSAALQAADQLITLNPYGSVGYQLRGWAYLMLSRHADAVTSLTEAITLNPADTMAYHIRAATYFDMHRYAASEADAAAIYRLAPNSPLYSLTTANKGWRYYEQEQYELAGETWRVVLEAVPDAVFPRCGLALLEARLGNAAESFRIFEEVTTQHPLQAQPVSMRGEARRILGDCPGALSDLDEALRRRETMSHAHARRAAVLLELGRNDESRSAVQRAIELNPYAKCYFEKLQADSRQIWCAQEKHE